jgi:hypothetical protein
MQALKGTLSREFRPPVFFTKHLHFFIGIPFKSSQRISNFEAPWSVVLLKVEYLGDYESMNETALTRRSWAQIELVDENNQS